MTKIYACEDRLNSIKCYICVGKENCKQFRYGDVEEMKFKKASFDKTDLKEKYEYINIKIIDEEVKEYADKIKDSEMVKEYGYIYNIKSIEEACIKLAEYQLFMAKWYGLIK